MHSLEAISVCRFESRRFTPERARISMLKYCREGALRSRVGDYAPGVPGMRSDISRGFQQCKAFILSAYVAFTSLSIKPSYIEGNKQCVCCFAM